jgi:hypothetical protein
MSVKIALRLQGVDLRDIEVYERIPAALTELSFEANGAVSVAVLYSDSPTPATEAAHWARLIGRLMPGVRVVRVHDELVSVSDVAARCGVAAEAVRLWAAGRRRASALRPFPAPREVIGLGGTGKTMNIYAWAEVVDWVRDVIGLDPDRGITYLDDRQNACLNAELADPEDHEADGPEHWQPLNLVRSVSAPVAPSNGVSSTTVLSLSRMDEMLREPAPQPGSGRAARR